MDGTTAVVVFLGVIGVLLAIIAIISATKKQWVLFTIFFIWAAACLLGAWYKPKVDEKRERDQQQAQQQILDRYPEIRKIEDLSRSVMKITYINELGERCSTTVVHRDDQWLVNTQTADCSK